ncbi:B12-binding domain-containing radical SAM protein [Verrucomicrobiota bacterium]
MRKLLLIHPCSQSQFSGFGDTAAWGMPPLALGYVAALTPPSWKIKIVDEYTDKLDLNEKVDLVGISTYSVNANRAYELASKFRKRGVAVVLGGIHASMVPQEASEYADAIVVGEAESIWPKVISDFEKGNLQKTYHGERLSLENLPVPRRDLISDKYEMDVIQTTRGCPFGCEFCSVTAFNGAEYRMRPVDEVLDELQQIKKKLVYFIDDNFLGIGHDNGKRALDICKGMISKRLNKIWVTQASINIGSCNELLRYAYKSGCRAIYIGFESIIPETLQEMKKTVNLRIGIDGCKKAIRNIHAHGICVIGAFIFGNDHDDVTVFKKTLDFINETGIDVAQLGILTPFPGTKLFKKLHKENRIISNIFPDDWNKCDTDHIMFMPKNLDIIELTRGMDYLARKIFTPKTALSRAVKSFIRTKSITGAFLSYNFNKDSWANFDTNRKFSLPVS